LDRRVFVSRRRSSDSIGRGGNGDLRVLALDGDAKKSVSWAWDSDGSDRLFDLRGVSATEVGGRFLKGVGSVSVS
jgi:hypothetical protein